MQRDSYRIPRNLLGEMAKVLDGGLKVSEFELQLLIYVHFRANTIGDRNKAPLSF